MARGEFRDVPIVAMAQDIPDQFTWTIEGGKFGITGDLNGSGFLFYAIHAKESPIRGKTFFNKMMEHFGPHVKGIAGEWTSGDNLAKFNELTALGVGPETAALSTFGGKMASRAGFSKVDYIYKVGLPGEYKIVEVFFVRPE